MFEEYNNNQQPNTSGEYHYSYRSDSSGFQPEQTPVPVTPKKPRRGRRKSGPKSAGPERLSLSSSAGRC